MTSSFICFSPEQSRSSYKVKRFIKIKVSILWFDSIHVIHSTYITCSFINVCSSDSISTLKNTGLPADGMAFIESLPADQASKLADTVLAALETKDARVEKAMNNALNVVPGPFRRPVKKMLFG